MRKHSFLIFTVLMLSIFVLSCAKSESVNMVEYSEVCNPANKGKSVTVQGFLAYGNKTPCVSMLRGDMKRDCGFKLMNNVNVVGEEIIAYLREGKGNNQAETPEAGQENVKPSIGFESSQVKFRLNEGTVVSEQKGVATPVIVTGEVSMSEGREGCSIRVDKIEKR